MKRVLPLVLLLTGCGFVGRVMSKQFTVPTTPQAVANKIRDPRRPDARIAVLWIGHATALIQMDDAFVLTDPVFTRTVGELSPRLVEPGMDPDDLPPLSAVVISHEHFDHLSYDSLDLIEHKTPIVLLPPGARSILPRYAFESRELDRWESYEAPNGVRITAVPVQHVGGRWGLDQAWDSRAFTGYVFQKGDLTVYFGGDSAFAPEAFTQTRARFPKIDLALLPICPIAPRKLMEPTHMDPKEALDAFALLGAAHMVPIHFDTWINSDDRPGECGRVLREEMQARGGDLAQRVAVLSIGEERVIVAKDR